MNCRCDAPQSKRDRDGECVKCGRQIGPGRLTAALAATWYARLHLGDLAPHMMARLQSGRSYGWLNYLRPARRNCAEGKDECVDGVHYALFEKLKLERRLSVGDVDEDQKYFADAHLDRAAEDLASALRHFEAAERATK